MKRHARETHPFILEIQIARSCALQSILLSGSVLDPDQTGFKHFRSKTGRDLHTQPTVRRTLIVESKSRSALGISIRDMSSVSFRISPCGGFRRPQTASCHPSGYQSGATVRYQSVLVVDLKFIFLLSRHWYRLTLEELTITRDGADGEA